jgi:hypothetical protein
MAFLFREAALPSPAVSSQKQYWHQARQELGHSDLLKQNLKLLQQQHPSATNNQCVCDHCVDEGPPQRSMDRPVYVLYYQPASPQPTAMCLTHMRTLSCNACTNLCEQGRHPHPFNDVLAQWKFNSVELPGGQRFMTWFCLKHRGHYGRCPECEQQGSFCHTVIRYINSYCSCEFVPVRKHFLVSNSSALSKPYHCQRGGLSGLFLNMVAELQALSRLQHILSTPFGSFSELRQNLEEEKWATGRSKEQVNQQLCSWEKLRPQLLQERVLAIAEQLDRQECLLQKVKSLKKTITGKNTLLDQFRQQLQQQLDRVAVLEVALQQRDDRLASIQSQDQTIDSLQAQLAQSKTAHKQLQLQLAQEKAGGQRHQAALVKAHQQQQELKTQLAASNSKLQQERGLREKLAKQLTVVEKTWARKLKQATTAKVTSAPKPAPPVDVRPLLHRIAELERIAYRKQTGHPPNFDPPAAVTLQDFLVKSVPQ